MKYLGIRVLAATIGALALYLAFFLFEDSEGKSRDRIEDLWSRIEDQWKRGGNRLTMLLIMVAQAANTILDRLFGKELVSARSLGISSSYSLFGFWIASSVLLENQDSRSLALQLFLGVLALFCGCCPLLFKAPSSTVIALCPCLAIPAIALGFSPMPLPQSFFLLGGLILGLAASLLTIAWQRRRIRGMCASRRLIAILSVIILQLLLPVMLFSLPFMIHAYFPKQSVNAAVDILTCANFSTELILLTFLIVLLLALVHKVLWPVLGRLVYALARHRIVHKPAVMAAIGLLCLFAALR